jgi:hypothetical protein
MVTLYNHDYAREYFGYPDAEVHDAWRDEVRFYGLRPVIEVEQPARVGAAVGTLAGPVALFAVHAGAAGAVSVALVSTAHVRAVPVAVAFMAAYATSAAYGAIVGSAFAVVTRYLRKWTPLVVWALVFFVSLAILLLAMADLYGRHPTSTMSGAVVLGACVFAGLVSFSLPFQRRG